MIIDNSSTDCSITVEQMNGKSWENIFFSSRMKLSYLPVLSLKAFFVSLVRFYDPKDKKIVVTGHYQWISP